MNEIRNCEDCKAEFTAVDCCAWLCPTCLEQYRKDNGFDDDGPINTWAERPMNTSC